MHANPVRISRRHRAIAARRIVAVFRWSPTLSENSLTDIAAPPHTLKTGDGDFCGIYFFALIIDFRAL